MRWGRDKTVMTIMLVASAIVIFTLFMAGIGLIPMRIKVIQLEPTTEETVTQP